MNDPLRLCATALLVTGVTQLLSCGDPVKAVKSNEALGFVIARESCSADSTKNGWLISFIKPPLLESNKVQDSINYKGRLYRYVVRTYAPIQSACIAKSQQQNGRDYCYFRFKTILPKRYACDSSMSFNVPEITDVTEAN